MKSIGLENNEQTLAIMQIDELGDLESNQPKE
jgi:hypothetical protein